MNQKLIRAINSYYKIVINGQRLVFLIVFTFNSNLFSPIGAHELRQSLIVTGELILKSVW